MVTSTSTPASMLTMICLTISVGAFKLWKKRQLALNQAIEEDCEVNILNEALVDAQLVAVPGLGTLTARRLTGGDLEGLGGETNGALDAEVLALGALDELGADLLEGVDLAGGEGDADLVRLGLLAAVVLVGLVVRHLGLDLRMRFLCLEEDWIEDWRVVKLPSRLERLTLRQSDEGDVVGLVCGRSKKSSRNLLHSQLRYW